MSDAQATALMIKVLRASAPKLSPEDEKINKFGAHHDGEWAEYVKFVGLDKTLTKEQVKSLYTNELIDEVNNFDRNEVIKRRKTSTSPRSSNASRR